MKHESPFATNYLPESAEFDRIQELQEQELTQLMVDVEAAIKMPQCKRVLLHILSRCHLYQNSMTGNSQTFFLEGERQVGLHILAMATMAGPELAAELITANLQGHARRAEEGKK